ncbi:uncharacterized protein LOC110725820 [Chenopodium quinoa]|nr:uncharacterized protein LOC110725820 [Chenopodium quinoa]XP_021760980.1 uncharacterized protein LOC110725820 [Chenopodium quinoa]XP_021760981.1 uncharacterized protein LOC110725820 [Chenopodium quinoa]
MSVCQTCGMRGIPELLVVCSKCQIASEHVYCRNKLAETDDDEVEWTCEFCEPRIVELSDSTNSVSDTESGELKDDAKEPLHTSLIEEAQSVRNAEAGPSTNEIQLFCRDLETSHDPKRQTHKYVVGDLHFPDEDFEATSARAAKSGSPETSCILEDDFCSNIEPLPDPFWKGSFKIYGEKSCTVHEMMAHLSNEACKEASEVTSSLPVLLRLEMVSKFNIWPVKFKETLPTAYNIAVYFFPDHRTERMYDCLVDDIVDRELAMISRINNVELLIFSSCELPPNYWRFKRKYYLWGMFRRKKKTLPQHQHDDSSSSIHSSINHTAPSKLSTETGGN